MSRNINRVLGEDELRMVLRKVEEGGKEERERFSLVCKRWLRLESEERVRLRARAGTHMLFRLLQRFPHLQHLDLSQLSSSRSFFPGLSDSDLLLLSSSLLSLLLRNCLGITDVGLAAIGCRLYSLHVLDVSNCKKITDKGLVSVTEGCRELRGLHLAGCKTITDAVLRSLSKNCHNLEELVLQGCFKITDLGLGDLVKGCQRIKHLNINKCSNIGDAGVSSVSKACSVALKTLMLLDCYKVGDKSILSLGRFCKSLETLVIGGCREISSESIELLASACGRTLRNLRMDWCLNVSDSSLNCIFSHCKKLEVLDIGCCEEVTDSAFSGFSQNGFQMSLKILKISNCPKITVVGIRLVLELCKFIEYIDVRSCPNITKTSCAEAGLQFPDPCKVNFCGSLAEPDLLL